MGQGVSIVALEACLHTTCLGVNHLAHWSGELSVWEARSVGSEVVAEHRLQGCECQSLDWSELFVQRKVDGYVLVSLCRVLGIEPRHCELRIEKSFCTIALYYVASFVEAIIIRCIIRQSHLGCYQRVGYVNLAVVRPQAVLTVVLYTEVGAETYLEEFIQARVDAGCQGTAAHLGILYQAIFLMVVE